MPRFRLEVLVNADTLKEAEGRLALVQAAVWAVEDARRGNPPEDIQEGLEALDVRLGSHSDESCYVCGRTDIVQRKPWGHAFCSVHQIR